MWTPLSHPWCGLGSKKQRHQRAGSQWSWNNLLLLFLATCLRGTVGSRGHLVSVGLEVLMPRRRHVHQAQSSIEPQPVVTRCFWGVGGWSSNNNSSGQDRLLLGTGVTSPEQHREGKALYHFWREQPQGTSPARWARRWKEMAFFASRGATAGED